MESSKVSKIEDSSSSDSLCLDESHLAGLPEANDKSKNPEARAVLM